MWPQLRRLSANYPRQFWLLFWGMLISSTGASMIWPFLMIYVTGKLALPLTTAASLITISAVMGLISSVIAGPIIDTLGRKPVMLISLAGNALGYFLMSRAQTFPAFALLMALNGASNPLYRVSVDAMMADLIPPQRRIDAYSLMRLSNNVGVALGPALGGLAAAISFTVAFYCGAAGLLTFAGLIGVFAVETLPPRAAHPSGPSGAEVPRRESFGGYLAILHDWPFTSFVSMFALVQVCAALMWVLLGVYVTKNYHLTEQQYSWMPTTNAAVVIFFQYGVTQVSKRFRPLRVQALGALFYAVAVFSIAFGRGYWAFWTSMVVMTFGELLLVPTSSTYAANLAPPDKRGRYMGLYGLTWLGAQSVGPVFGGFLSDSLGPQAPWLGGGLVGLISVIGYLRLKEAPPLEERLVKEEIQI
jgi:MFS family permease